MKRFSSYLNHLNESVNTPIQFDLTDDTQLPYRIYAVFNQDNDMYGMSLEQSDYAGIYLLDFYRITSKQKRLWSFKKPSHILPGLSTLIKFAEAVIPFVKTKMKGIIVKIPGENAERYIRFGTRLVKKSYISTFRVLPVTKSPDKKIYNWEMMFLGKVGISPASVFSDTKFKKYGFSTEVLSHGAVAEIKTLKKPKNILRTKPSSRYTIGAFSTDFELSADLLSNIQKIEEISIGEIKEKVVKKYDISDASLEYITNILDIKDETIIQEKIIPFVKEVENNHVMVKYAIFMKSIPSGLNSPNVESLLKSIGEFNYFMRWSIQDIPKSIVGIFYVNGLNLDEYSIIIDTSTDLDKMRSIHKANSVSDLKDITKKLEAYEKATKSVPFSNFYKTYDLLDKINNSKTKFSKITNIDPRSLISTIPGSGGFNYDTDNILSLFNDNGNAEGFDLLELVNYIEETLGYSKQINNLSSDVLNAIKRYTGSNFGVINNSLRSVFNDFMESGKLEKSFIDERAFRITQAFEKLEPLKEPMWVYRSSKLPDSIRETIKVGGDFMDPAIMSTTVNSGLEFDSSGDRFRIFVPAGARIIPILNNSKHPGENEIILPPMSVLKIIRIDGFKDKNLYTCIYVGSAFKDYVSKNTDLSENTKKPAEKKEMSKYDPREKFNGTTDEKTLKAAAKYIEIMKKKRI